MHRTSWSTQPVILKVFLAQSSPYWLRPRLQLDSPFLFLLTSASFPHQPTCPLLGYWSQGLSLRGCCSTNSFSQLTSKEINLQPSPPPNLSQLCFKGDITTIACQDRPLFPLSMTNNVHLLWGASPGKSSHFVYLDFHCQLWISFQLLYHYPYF